MVFSTSTSRFAQVATLLLTIIVSGAIAQATTTAHPAPHPSPTPKPQPQLPKPEFATETTPLIPTLACDKSPGAGLCYALTDVVTDYGNSCSGEAKCDAVWMAQSGSDSNLDSQFEMDVLPSDIPTQQIATLAFYAALEICSQKPTGTDNYGYQAIVAEIKLLPRLLFLQKAAGVTNPETCKISL